MNWLKLIQRKAQHFYRLQPAQRRLFWHALGLLWLVSYNLRWGKLQTVQSQLTHWYPCNTEQIPLDAQITTNICRTVRMVRLAARYTPSAKCLQRSLVLWALLRRYGIASELKIAAQKDTPIFAAHAWLEYQGHVLNDAPDVRQRFAVFQR